MDQCTVSAYSRNVSHPNKGEVRKRPSFGRWLAILLLLLPCLFLTSCVSLDENPASALDPNPPAEAIVGMWTGTIYANEKQHTVSAMFSADGTGLSRGTIEGDQNFQYTWKYDGGGYWTVWHVDCTLRYRMTLPAADGSRALYLVSHSGHPQGISVKHVRLE
jgi:hypothetical protein